MTVEGEADAQQRERVCWWKGEVCVCVRQIVMEMALRERMARAHSDSDDYQCRMHGDVRRS
jgi:hypothetical protein